MRSSSGSYYPCLDHVRALAAFLVFYWHCVHIGVDTKVLPAFPSFSVLEEGWTGVALFMTLSGYLFARIIGDSSIHYLPFLWNRLVRLGPLLAVVIV